MVEWVVCPFAGKYRECERDRCQHRNPHERYDKCDIPTCGGDRGVACVRQQVQPMEETEVPDYHGESLGEVGK